MYPVREIQAAEKTSPEEGTCGIGSIRRTLPERFRETYLERLCDENGGGIQYITVRLQYVR